MAFQAVPEGIRVALQLKLDDVPIVNVWHIKSPASVTALRLLEVCEIVEAWWAGVYSYDIITGVAFVDIVATDISVEDGEQITLAASTQATGRNATAGAAANAAACVSFGTGRTGRSYRGRTYVGGLAQSYLLDSLHFTNAAVASFNADLVALVDALETAGYVLSVLSRVLNGVQRIVGVLTEIITVTTNNKIDSQRRRTAN